MDKHFKIGVIGVGMVGTPLVKYLSEPGDIKEERIFFV